jgi:hypothetical protein
LDFPHPRTGTPFANTWVELEIVAVAASGVSPANRHIHRTLEGTTRIMAKKLNRAADRAGKIKYGIVAWLIGLPLPIIILALFWGGCDF